MTAVLIRCKLKRSGGSDITMANGDLIKFRPDQNGDHVAMVTNPAHIDRLMSIPEGYGFHGMAGGTPDPVVPPEPKPEPVATVAHAAPEPDAPEPTAAPDAGMELDAMTDDDLKAFFEKTVGRTAHHKAKRETLIAQIEAHQEEAAG